MLSRKIKKTYKNGVTIEEFRDTLDKAINLSNKLIEIIIDDYLQKVFFEDNNNQKVHICAEIYAGGIPRIANVYKGDRLCYIFSYRKKESIENILYSLYEIFSPNTKDHSLFYCYIQPNDDVNIDNLKSNIELYQTITSMIYDIQSIYWDKNYNLISNLSIIKPSDFFISFKYNFENKKYELEKDVITFEDEAKWLNSNDINEHKIIPNIEKTITNIFGKKKTDWLPSYLNLKDFVDKYGPIILDGDEYNANNQIEIPNKLPLANYDFYQKNGNIKKIFYNKDIIKLYDLSNINFDKKNISGIDISKNPEVKINFDKIVKDLTDSNINGYNLNKYIFRNYNLTNTDLRNTGATIDILSCNINTESKMSPGTLFDENNKFIVGDKKIPNNEIEKYGIKIKKIK